MKNLFTSILFIALVISSFTSCQKKGCTDINSINFDINAKKDDGSCIPIVYGCTDPNSKNYNPNANTDDGSCIYKGNATFYQQYFSNEIYVVIEGSAGVQYSAYITAGTLGTTPDCGAAGCANFTNIPSDTYFYSAVDLTSGHTWSGSIDVPANGCAQRGF